MNIQLIKGEFNAEDALDLITQMIHVKIKYHENKIGKNSSEEDIKYRESKVKHLQKELYQLRSHINAGNKKLNMDSVINIE